MIILTLLGCVLAALLAVCCWIFVRCFVRWPMPHERVEYPRGGVYSRCWDQLVELVDAMEREGYEQARILARDGVPLYARHYVFCAGAPTHILLHGYRGSYQDMCGCFKIAKELGHNVLLVSQRAHGASRGRVITFGVREQLDCVDWARLVAEKTPDAPIVLWGVSMGAATVLMASALDLPPQVAGFIADCPYTSATAIIRTVCRRNLGVPPSLAMPFVHLSAAVFGGFRLSDSDALAAVKRARVPMLLVHGGVDALVPCSMSRELAAACASRATLVSIPAADHGIAYMTDPAAYTCAVKVFLKAVLGD